MKKRVIIVVLILLTLGLLANKDYCLGAEIDFGEGINIPLFPAAKDIWGGPQTLEINGISTKAASFDVDNSISDIFDFYKTQMSNSGWQLGEIWEGINAIYFTKDAALLYVVGNGLFQVFDSSFPNTKFLLVLSKIPLHICIFFNNILGSDSKDTAGRDLPFISRYPGSTRLINIIRGDKEAFLVYKSKEEASKIVDFYRKNLPAYGWRISQRLTVPRTCINAIFSATAIVFERGNKDNVSIYLTYCPSVQANFIIISYNFAFNYPIFSERNQRW